MLNPFDTYVHGSPVNDIDNKDISTEEAVRRKRKVLDEYADREEVEIVDGDTVRSVATGKNIRIGGYDSAESSQYAIDSVMESNPLKMEYQRQAYADQFGGRASDVTNDMLINWGQAAKQRLVDNLGVDENGKTFIYKSAAVKSKLEGDQRLVYQIHNSSGDNVGEVLDTAENNTAFNAKWNREERIREQIIAKKARIRAAKGQVATGFSDDGISVEVQLDSDGSYRVGDKVGLTRHGAESLVGAAQAEVDSREAWGSDPLRQAAARLVTGTGVLIDTVVYQPYLEHIKFAGDSRGKAEAVKKLKAQQSIDAKRVDRVSDTAVDELIEYTYKTEGLGAAILAGASNIRNYSERIVESIPHMIALAANPWISIPVMGGMVSTAVSDNTAEFVRVNGREPTEDESNVLGIWSAIQVGSEKLGAEFIFGKIPGADKLVKKFLFSNKALGFLGKTVASAPAEGAEEAFTEFATEMAVKQDTSKVDDLKLVQAGIAGAFGGPALAGTAGARDLVQAVKKGDVKVPKIPKTTKPEIVKPKEVKVEKKHVSINLVKAVKDSDQETFVKHIQSSTGILKHKDATKEQKVQAVKDLIYAIGAFDDKESKKWIAKEIKENGADIVKGIEEFKKEADKLQKDDLILYSGGRDIYSKETLTGIAESESVSEEVREAAAELAQVESIGETHKGVVYGTDGFVGMQEYVADAKEGNLTSDLKKQMTGFVAHLKDKADIVEKGVNGKGTIYLKKGMGNKPVDILPPGESAGPGKEHGYVYINKDSGALLKAVRADWGVAHGLATIAVAAQDAKSRVAVSETEVALAEQLRVKTLKGFDVDGEVKEEEVKGKEAEKAKEVTKEPTTTKPIKPKAPSVSAAGTAAKEPISKETKPIKKESDLEPPPIESTPQPTEDPDHAKEISGDTYRVNNKSKRVTSVVETGNPIIANDGKTEIVAKNIDGTIYISTNNELWEKYFNEKRWTKPRLQPDNSKAKPLDRNAFDSVDHLKAFVIEHEKSHNVIKRKASESTGDYETRVNNHALSVLNVDTGTTYSKELKGLVGRGADEFIGDKDGKSLDGLLEDTIDQENIMDSIGTENFSGSDIVASGKEALGEVPSSLRELGHLFDLMKESFIERVNSSPDLFKVGPEVGALYVDGKLQDRVIYAMTVGAANWLTANSKATESNDRHMIGNYLYGEWDAELSDKEFKAMSGIGIPMNTASQSAGSDIRKTLGIGFKKGTAGDVARTEELEASLGLMMLDILSRVEVDGKRIVNTPVNSLDLGPKVEGRTLNPFGKKLAPLRTVQVADHKTIAGIVKALRGSEEIFSKINGVQVDKQNIYTDGAPEHVQDRASGSLSKLSGKVVKLIKKMQGTEWFPVKENLAVVSRLNQETLKQLGGWADSKLVHNEMREGVNSKNRDIEKDLALIGDLKGVDSFWFKYKAMSQHRILIDSNGINPLRSKIHRFLVAPGKGFGAEIRLKDKKEMAIFKLAVAQAFGADIDKNSLGYGLEAFSDIRNDPKVQVVVNAIINGNEQELNSAVREMGGNFHQLAGVVALAEFQKAISGGKESFNTTLGIETDAVTSGYAIGLMQFMGATKDKFLRVGISLDGKAREYRDSLDAKADDTYTFISRIVADTIEKSPVADALSRVHGEITRGLAKPAFMIRNYEAGLDKSIEGVTNDMVSKIYEKLADLQNRRNNAKSLTERNQITKEKDAFAADLSVLAGKEVKLDGNLNEVDIKESLESIVKTAASVYKPAFNTAFKELIGNVKDRKAAISQSVEGMYYAFKNRYDKDVAKKESEVGHKLNKAEKREVAGELIDSHFPSMKTFDTDGSFIDMVATGREGASREVSNKVNPDKRVGKTSKSSSIQIQNTGFKAPGAAALVRMIQNIDSLILGEVMMKYEAISLYDAGYYGLGDVVDATAEYNKSFLNVSKKYRLADEVLKRSREIYSNLTPTERIEVDALLKKSGRSKIGLVQRGKVLAEVATSIEQEFAEIKGLEESSSDQAYFPLKRGEEVTDDRSVLYSLGETREDLQRDLELRKRIGTTTVESLGEVNQDLKEMDGEHETVEHKERLDGLLSKLINPLMGTIDALTLTLNRSDTLANGWFKRGENSITVNYRDSGPKTYSEQSRQEVYLHELVHSVASGVMDSVPRFREKVGRMQAAIHQDLVKKYGVGKAWRVFLETDRGDLIDAREEIKRAKEQYQAAFGMGSVQEFLAYGLSNRAMASVLGQMQPQKRKWVSGDTWYEKLVNVLVEATEWLADKINKKEPSANMYLQLLDLTQAVTGVTNSKTGIIAKKVSRYTDTEVLDNWIKKNAPGIPKKFAGKVASIGAKATGVTKGFGGMAQWTHTNAQVLDLIFNELDGKNRSWKQKVDQAKKLLDIPGDMRIAIDSKILDYLYKQWVGMVKQTPMYLSRGITKSNHLIEQARVQEKERIVKQVKAAFKGGEPSLRERKALTQVIARTEFYVLVDELGIDRAMGLIADKDKLDNFLADQLRESNVAPGTQLYHQMMGLSDRRVFGRTKRGMVGNNAQVAYEQVPDREKEKVSLDKFRQLVALASLKKVDSQAKKLVADVADRELGKGNFNGIVATVGMLKGGQMRAKEAFIGQERMMRDGYVSQITDPHKDIVTANSDAETQRVMAEKGYEFKNVHQSKPDTALYFAKNLPLDTQTKGLFSTTSKKRAGSSVVDIFMGDYDGAENYNQIREKYLGKLAKMESNKGMAAGNDYAIRPVYNAKGKLVDFTYDMGLSDINKFLDLNTDIFDVMGQNYSTITDKLGTEKVNSKGIDSLVERYKEHYQGNEHEFVNILDAKWVDETFVRLPHESRERIKKIAGNKREFWVEEAYVDAIFGYRNWSISELGFIKSEKAKRNIRIIEEAISGVVGIVNNNIVIKTPVVPLFNFASNFTTSVISGVSPIQVIKYWREGLRELRVIQADMEALAQFDNRARVDKAWGNKHQGRRNKLVRRINANPTKELVDAGLYSAITTEGMHADEFSYKNQFVKKINKQIEEKLGKKGQYLTSIVKGAYIAEDTSTYQSMLAAVQVSDFLGRYGVYKEMLSKGKSKDDAFQYIQDVYVDFNVPVGKFHQWANSMGMIMFYKYFIKIQRPIFGMIKHHPTKSMATLGMRAITGMDVPSIFGTGIVTGGNFAPMLGWFSPLEMIKQFAVPSGLELGVNLTTPIGMAGAAYVGGATYDAYQKDKVR